MERSRLQKQLKIVPSQSGKSLPFTSPRRRKCQVFVFTLHAPFRTRAQSGERQRVLAANEPFVSTTRCTHRPVAEQHSAYLGLLNVEFPFSVAEPGNDKLPESVTSAFVPPLSTSMNKQLADAKSCGLPFTGDAIFSKRKPPIKKAAAADTTSKFSSTTRSERNGQSDSSQKNSDADRFLEGLAIQKWDIEEFVELL